MQWHALLLFHATALPDSPCGNKYTANHCTAEEEWGQGLITLLAFGRSLLTSLVLGIIFRSVGRHPKK
jgi:hypothetical protein